MVVHYLLSRIELGCKEIAKDQNGFLLFSLICLEFVLLAM